jgi:hypothetical protein
MRCAGLPRSAARPAAAAAAAAGPRRRAGLPPRHPARPAAAGGGGLSYKDAGVDIDAGNELVRRIRKLNPSIGGFSGMVPFGAFVCCVKGSGGGGGFRRHDGWSDVSIALRACWAG